jgi:hypothetical protein
LTCLALSDARLHISFCTWIVSVCHSYIVQKTLRFKNIVFLNFKRNVSQMTGLLITSDSYCNQIVPVLISSAKCNSDKTYAMRVICQFLRQLNSFCWHETILWHIDAFTVKLGFNKLHGTVNIYLFTITVTSL